jgi:CheY-like chemotaxis protein
VLLIEDNTDAAQSLRHLLEADGHEVRVEHSGPAGIDAAKAFVPEVILCDIGLPGMDGYEVGRALRRLPGPRPVLVALTGYATEADMQRTAQAGFDHHFAKPPDLGRLCEIMANMRP